MGVAQGMGILLDLAEQLLARADVGFLFVGRVSDAIRLKASAQNRGLNNVLFFDEIHPDEIPDLYAQCHVGIVSLDPRHKSHNIPGKFLTNMQSGLSVLANVNASNELSVLKFFKGKVMNIQEAQRLFYELYDEWEPYHIAAYKLRAELTQAFAGVANGGSANPSLGVLAMLESMEVTEKRLKTKMDEVIDSIKD
jgi:hypothetical protein